MNVVTRFNPSCNGGLHIGHAYTLIVNEEYARERGGRHLVRFDDSSLVWGDTPELQGLVRDIRRQQQQDIEWLGLQVDGWYSQEEMMPEVEATWKTHGYIPQPFVPKPVIPHFVSRPKGWIAYPYQPRLAAERAVFDHLMGVTHVIRGEDLACDLSLQCYFHDLFGYPIPTFIFLPRLVSSRGDISKTAGGCSIAELRADGHTPASVRKLLNEACLITSGSGWALENLKMEPRVKL